MRVLVSLFVISLSSVLYSQSEPQFYTDSKVRTRRFAISTYSQPMVLFRRIGADLNGNRPEVNNSFRTGPNLDVGFSIDFNIRPLRIGIGLGHSWVNYSVVEDEPLYSADGIIRTSASYISLPFRAGLITPLNDRVNLEVWPEVIYRQAISFEKDWLIDMAPNYRDIIWSAGINIGSSITLSEYWKWTIMGVMDYGFNDFEEPSGDGISELPIFIGLRTGIRLSI